MNLSKMLLIIVAGYGLALSGCGGDLKPAALPTYTFYIQNNSKDTLRYSSSTLFPDTSILNNLDSSVIYPSQQSKIEFPTYLLPNFETSGWVEIFLFNIDTLQKYPWQTIISSYLITERYELTYDSIKADNGVIKYP
jgi:hypothetical protein